MSWLVAGLCVSVGATIGIFAGAFLGARKAGDEFATAYELGCRDGRKDAALPARPDMDLWID